MRARLRLVVHLAKSDSNWTAAMDSPDQGASGIHCGQVNTPADSLIIEAPLIRGRYPGAYQADSLCYAGVWQQEGLALPLNLRKSDVPIKMSRPQAPKPPYPYRSEEVTIPNEKAGLTLAGTLTLPTDTDRKFDFAGVKKIVEIILCQAPDTQPFPLF